MELRESVAIVTGGSRGLGVHIADALARRGAHIALAARSEPELEEVAARLRERGVNVVAVVTDVADRAALHRLVDRTTNELGPIDILVNNAGLEITGYSHELDADEIDRVVGVNLTSVIQLSRIVLPGMVARRRGHICNIASAAGVVARPYATVYSATKHGVVGFSWSLRAEMATQGVEVSVVCPSYVSDAGMFADRVALVDAGDPPPALKPVTPTRVAEETMRSIEANRAHFVVGPPLTKVAGAVHAISPDVAIAVARRSGALRYMKKEATGD
ncbi:MAG TPA: SDR family NAD(P)-dependent oxidoreductase [Actinomycetota bacterium]|nr:SDR family NAD(P)-dependent oxidoreductase [Actinomycetota bacterium]